MENFDQAEKSEKIISETVGETTQSIPTTSPEQKLQSHPFVQSLTAGSLVGLLSYWIAPVLFNLNTSGKADEIAALLIAVSVTILSTISNAKKLCKIDKEQIAERKFNVAKGAIGGGLAGGGLVKLLVAADLLATGGIISGSVLVGTSGALLYNRITKKKYCPHCGKRGKCTQRVCRFCLKLFFPESTKLDCIATPKLTWYALSSYLQTGYDLNYIASSLLLQEHVLEWTTFGANQSNVVLDCNKFKIWAQKNDDKIIDANDKVRQMSKQEIADYLDNNNL